MNIKRGLTLAAFGFLFTLVNLNLTYNGFKVNVMPDFLGWLLLFLSFDCFGSYAEGKQAVKWAFLFLVIAEGVTWVYETFKPELALPASIGAVIAVVGTIALFFFLGILEKVARAYNSVRESTLHTLKYVNLILYIAVQVSAQVYASGYLLTHVSNGSAYQDVLGVLIIVLSFAAFAAAVVTAVVLFGLKKEIAGRT